MNLYMHKKNDYIGFYLDKDDVEKLKIIAWVTKQDRSVLLREAVQYIIDKYDYTFDEFTKMAESMKGLRR